MTISHRQSKSTSLGVGLRQVHKYALNSFHTRVLIIVSLDGIGLFSQIVIIKCCHHESQLNLFTRYFYFVPFSWLFPSLVVDGLTFDPWLWCQFYQPDF